MFGMNPELQTSIWFALGAFSLLRGNTLRNKYQRLAQQGLRTTGIVTRVIDDSWLKFYNNQGLYQHSIRFVTADQRWISKSYTSLVDDLESRYHEGETINIIYNPDDPEEFIVGSSTSSLGSIIFILSGLVCIGYSCWLIFQQL